MNQLIVLVIEPAVREGTEHHVGWLRETWPWVCIEVDDAGSAFYCWPDQVRGVVTGDPAHMAMKRAEAHKRETKRMMAAPTPAITLDDIEQMMKDTTSNDHHRGD